MSSDARAEGAAAQVDARSRQGVEAGRRADHGPADRVKGGPTGWWVTPHQFGIGQEPVVLMVENYRTCLIWELVRRWPPVVTGLRQDGFTSGWL
jgi:hypothetical protein